MIHLGGNNDIATFFTLICLHRVKIPDLFHHIEKLEVSYTIFSTKWFICLYIDVLPVEVSVSMPLI